MEIKNSSECPIQSRQARTFQVVDLNLAGGTSPGGNFIILSSHWGASLLFEQAFVFRLLLGAYRRDQPVYQLRRLVLQLVIMVTAQVHGDTGVGATENLVDNDHRNTVVENQKCWRVLQVVKADFFLRLFSGEIN